MYARTSRWIPAHPAAVAARVDDPERWGTWLPVADASAPVGEATWPGRLHTAGRPVEVVWRRAPDARDVRVWEAVADDAVVATLRVVVVRWGDGAQVQLEVDRPGARRGTWWTGQLLDDGLHRLARQVAAATSRPGAASRPARRPVPAA